MNFNSQISLKKQRVPKKSIGMSTQKAAEAEVPKMSNSYFMFILRKEKTMSFVQIPFTINSKRRELKCYTSLQRQALPITGGI